MQNRSTMKKHTPEEIVTKFRCVEKHTAEGSTVADAVRETLPG